MYPRLGRYEPLGRSEHDSELEAKDAAKGFLEAAEHHRSGPTWAEIAEVVDGKLNNDSWQCSRLEGYGPTTFKYAIKFDADGIEIN